MYHPCGESHPDCCGSRQDLYLTQPPACEVMLQFVVVKSWLADTLPPSSVCLRETIQSADAICLGQLIAMLSVMLTDEGDLVPRAQVDLFLHDVVDLTDVSRDSDAE